MKGMLSNRWLRLSLRVISGGVFLYAGILKTQSPLSFADNLASFQLLPNPFLSLVALSLPIFEMAVGTMLITGIRLRLASFSALLLSAIFAVALVSALARGLNIDCGCFGNGTTSLQKTWLSLGRDLLLGLMAFVIRSQA